MPPKKRTQRNAAGPSLPQSKQHSSKKLTEQAPKPKAKGRKADVGSHVNQTSDQALQLPKPAPAVSERYNFRQRKQERGADSRQDRSARGIPVRKQKRDGPRQSSTAHPVAEIPRAAKASFVNAWAHGVAGLEPSSSSSRASSDSSSAGRETIAEYYRRQGYQGLEDDMDSVQASSTRQSSEVGSQRDGQPKTKSIGPEEGEFSDFLRNRRVNLEPSLDPNQTLVAAIRLQRTSDVTIEEEERWQKDLSKCSIANEALFQRTIMMDIFNRYKLNEHLDYMVEAKWTCPEVPRENSSGPVKVKAPRPDLAVAFKTKSVLDGQLRDVALGDMRIFMCPEGPKNFNYQRAFHFLSVEVKGVRAGLGNIAVSFQNLNTASQALYNMWLFFQKAGKEQDFEKNVRVFSVSATHASFSVRVHWAQKIHNPQPYDLNPLEFHFQELQESSKAGYDKAGLSNIVKNILDEYAVKKLLPKLQKVVKEVLQQRHREKLAALPPQLAVNPRTMGPPPPAARARKHQNSFNSTTTENDLISSAAASFSATSQESSNNGSKKRAAGAEKTASQKRNKRGQGKASSTIADDAALNTFSRSLNL